MTLEHKLVVGLDDIKAVVFECRQCGTRVSMVPADVRIPNQCPTGACASVWIMGKPAGMTSEYEASTSAHLNFVSAIGYIRKHNGAAFRILLEFDSQPKPDSPTRS
jgi:hypothetical protein